MSESMSARIWNRSLRLTALAVAVVAAISIGAAWRASAEFTTRLAGLTLAPILVAASVSYALRVLRFRYFLSQSGIALSWSKVFVAQTIGVALAVTPGRVGEVFKLHLVREHTGKPIAQTAPLLVLERLTEGGGFLILALASAPLLPALRSRLPMPALTILGLGVIVAFALTRKWWSPRVSLPNLRWTDSRWWQLGAPHFKNLWRGMQTSFTSPQILGGLMLSALARFADGWVVLFAAQMLRVELELPEAIFILAVSGLTGGISFLPAGLGAVETTMIGLLVMVGAPWSNALAIALVTRLFTLWLWVAVGLVVAFGLRLPLPRTRVKPDEEV